MRRTHDTQLERRRSRLYALAALVALGVPALLTSSASAETAPSAMPSSPAVAAATPPIAIAPGCSYKTLNSGFGFGNSQLNLGHGYNFFTVKFTNTASVTANEVVFQIDFGKASRIVIPDAGTFAPGATMNTTFRDNGKEMVYSARPTPNDGSVICSVVSARFADGTTYNAPPTPAPEATPSP